MEDNYLQKIPHRYEVDLLNIKKDFLHKLYSNIEFRWTSICREKTDLKIFEKYLLDYLQIFKFITINVHSLGQKSKIDKEDLNSLTVDVTIRVEKQCIIIDQIDLSIISHIFNVLKEQGIIIIDTTNESILTEETILENQVKEEIRNVCMCYLQDINQNYFMEITISAIVGYTIRRFFCPTEYFKDPSFFDFEGDCINERIIKEKFDNLLKSKDFDEKKFSEIKQLAETKDINKSQHEFKVKEFIKLREIMSDENKSIYLVLHLKSLHVFAMKTFTKKDELTKEAKHEIDFVKNYSHRCITHFYGFIKDDKTGKIIDLIYEFMSNGSLRPNVDSNLDKINEVFVLNTIIRILLGIDYLHSNNLIHRDLKPSNILLDHDFLPYISDFETIISTEDEDANFTDDIGSPLYTSPEQERGERLTSATDIYSFGLIIYFLFNKKDMFGNCGSFFFMKKITDKIYELACGSENLEKIYSDCLQFNQENRTSAKEIINALHSEFLTFIVRNSFLNSEKFQKKQFIFENFLIQQDFEEYMDLLCILSQYEGKCDYDDALVKNNLNILKILGDAYYYGHNLYDYGHYIIRDYSKAMKYYELLAIKGNSEGMARLGSMYYKGKGLEKDIKRAQEFLTAAAKLNNSDAMIGLGKIYLKNPSDKSNNNVQEAIKLFEQSCELGNSYGFYYLAKLYFKGKYVEQNYEKAKEYLEDSINRNKINPDIYYLLGLMYQSGNGVTKDIKIAKDYFKKAKEINLPCKILIDFDKKMLHYFDQEGGKNKLNEDSDLINEQEYDDHKIVKYQENEDFGSKALCNFKLFAKFHSGINRDSCIVIEYKGDVLEIGYHFNDIEIFSLLSHPNIMELIGYYFGNETLLPLNFHEFSLSENKISNADIIYQIADGMKYAHSKKCSSYFAAFKKMFIYFVHFINCGNSKLIDVQYIDNFNVPVLPLCYMEPELIEEELYDEKLDAYSFAILFSFILNEELSPKNSIEKVLSEIFPSIFNSVKSISKDIINQSWNNIPKNRLNIDDILNDLMDGSYSIID